MEAKRQERVTRAGVPLRQQRFDSRDNVLDNIRDFLDDVVRGGREGREQASSRSLGSPPPLPLSDERS